MPQNPRETLMHPPKRRYETDMLRISVAKRMVTHEARLSTVRRWCGVSEARVRELYRNWAHERGVRYAVRHRGPIPRQPAIFLRSAQVRSEAAALSALCGLFEIIPARALANPRRELPNLQRGEQLLRAYELFLSVVGSSAISLDQALLLLTAITQASALRLGHCAHCGAAIVFDPNDTRRRSCGRCDHKPPVGDQTVGVVQSERELGEGVQQSLF